MKHVTHHHVTWRGNLIYISSPPPSKKDKVSKNIIVRLELATVQHCATVLANWTTQTWAGNIIPMNHLSEGHGTRTTPSHSRFWSMANHHVSALWPMRVFNYPPRSRPRRYKWLILTRQKQRFLRDMPVCPQRSLQHRLIQIAYVELSLDTLVNVCLGFYYCQS